MRNAFAIWSTPLAELFYLYKPPVPLDHDDDKTSNHLSKRPRTLLEW